MKLKSHTIKILVFSLIASQTNLAYAQSRLRHIPVQEQARRDPAQEQARKDAEKHVHRFLWFLSGCATGSIAGMAMAEAMLEESDTAGVGLLAVVSNLTLIGFALWDSPAPKPEDLLGKPPEYVKTYVKEYGGHVRNQRIVSNVMGCCIGGGVGFTATAILIDSLLQF